MPNGSDRRKGSSDKKYKENYPKMENEFIPKWKRKLNKELEK